MQPDPPIWTPSAERIAASNLTAFAHRVRESRGAPAGTGDPVRDYFALWRWSIEAREQFWDALFDYAGVVAERGHGPVLQDRDAMPGARFFPAARLNFAENLLQRRDDHPALIFANERGDRREISHAQLVVRVARVAAALEADGIVAGDVVAGYLPNLPETVIAMLATASLGAVWTSCSPDFGAAGLLDRFGQVQPVLLFAADGYFYAGKQLDSRPTIRELLENVPSIRRAVIVPYVEAHPDLSALPRTTSLADFESPHAAATTPRYVRQPFNAPLYILYSSGTTGRPKCIVHGAGGALLQHRKEHLLHADLKPDDRLLYVTTCGWMMWNWLVSGLATGATLLLYEGSPLHPGPGALWSVVARERVSIFGTSAKYLAALQKTGYEPRHHHALSALRTVLSTGSPLSAEQFDYVYAAVKADLQLASISGGTDIVSCFCLGAPWLPVYRGEIQAAGLGMAVAVWNDAAQPVTEERGELVCTAPFPAMPLGFFADPDGRKYHAAYFERFANVWHHGDYAVATARGGFVILGRSDAVLNPGGVRIGTAEIYRQVETLDEILESLAIGQRLDGDERIVLFVRLRPGVALDADLEARIRRRIRENTTPRHVPAKILAVAEMPRTLSGKLVEIAVRNVVHGLPAGNTEALANPQALEHFRDRRELRE